MRLVQMAVPPEKHDVVVDLLEDRELNYTIADETSNQGAESIVSVPIETGDVEEFLDSLREVGIEQGGYAIITDVEAILGERESGTERTAQPDTTPPLEPFTSNRISREELQDTVTEMAVITPSYVFFTVVSSIVACTGLLTNSPAVIVGSMVIAPLLGPAVGASVGSIVNDEQLFRTSVLAQGLGLVLAVGSATVFAYLIKFTILSTVDLHTIDEVVSRINPGALSLIVALGSGAVGAFSVSSGASAPLVGVMIAAALIPPAAAVGLSIAYWSPVVLISVTVLLIVNILSINFASLGVLWIRGYRPTHWAEQEIAKRTTMKRIGTLLIGILIVSSFLITTSININQNNQFEEDVDSIAAESDVRILSINTSYELQPFTRTPTAVTVHAETDSNRFADRFRHRIKNRTGADVSVTVVQETVVTSNVTSGTPTPMQRSPDELDPDKYRAGNNTHRYPLPRTISSPPR
ncbi:TIGR00341 family protein [Halocatena salina]|uniref:TIGR00341 family protein n=1 Tax=Halocatena salina TaxID=2934340 RepID=A0A8U0A4G1_9EURY|nr:TIGR00341 family protein [Halocatena salina]UPM42833.1 TIGR00341 family protein [Halocatena salina]